MPRCVCGWWGRTAWLCWHAAALTWGGCWASCSRSR
ncbi:SWIM zinc finger family protein [Deinococcus sp.]